MADHEGCKADAGVEVCTLHHLCIDGGTDRLSVPCMDACMYVQEVQAYGHEKELANTEDIQYCTCGTLCMMLRVWPRLNCGRLDLAFEMAGF